MCSLYLRPGTLSEDFLIKGQNIRTLLDQAQSPSKPRFLYLTTAIRFLKEHINQDHTTLASLPNLDSLIKAIPNLAFYLPSSPKRTP